MGDPRIDIINECAMEICKFLSRDPYHQVTVTGQGGVKVQRPVWGLVRGRIFNAVQEISRLEVIKPSNGDGSGDPG